MSPRSLPESRKAVEHAWTVDTSQEAEMFLRQHPERIDDFRRWVDYVGGHAHADHVVSQVREVVVVMAWYELVLHACLN